MSAPVTLDGLMRIATSSVGLVTSSSDGRFNVMAAEWSYIVAKSPIHFAIGCQLTNHSTMVIQETGQFGLTLCGTDQASLANFVGTFSGAEIDKSRTTGMALRPAQVLSTPTVAGGLLSAECQVRNVVQLPGYSLIIGEAAWVEANPATLDYPLVKHGSMYRLGERIHEPRITAAVTRMEPFDPSGETKIRLCASAYGVDRKDPVPWSISLRENPSATPVPLSQSFAHDDLDVVISLPADVGVSSQLVVGRPDCQDVEVSV